MAKESGMIFRKSKNPVNKSTIQKILRNRTYMGEFEWNQKVHKGNHQPLVDPELWEQCQHILSGRYNVRTKSTKHQFAFSGLITCGHCHSDLVGEIKKGKYIYYHCTGHKGKCPEPYVREEVLEEKFSSIVNKLQFTSEVLEWIKEALLQSNQDVRQFHDEAITRLQAEYQKLESRLEMVTCNACERFTPDKIGDGAGIGCCELGVKWTQEFNGHMPLFRYSERHCKHFSRLMD